MTRREGYFTNLEPATRQFVEQLAASGAFPLPADRPPASGLHSQTAIRAHGKPNASIEDTIFPVGPKGAVPVRIVRPKNTTKILPVVMFFHGGGWVAGRRRYA